ncbi:MAG: hypothetical protein KDJ80_05615 [Nitratireductor sp.]|nr:hypothetical protein [Nitratireductor sp.]
MTRFTKAFTQQEAIPEAGIERAVALLRSGRLHRYNVMAGFTGRYDSWRYIEDLPDLAQTRRVLSTTCDMRVPLTFDVEDCRLITAIIGEECAAVRKVDRA